MFWSLVLHTISHCCCRRLIEAISHYCFIVMYSMWQTSVDAWFMIHKVGLVLHAFDRSKCTHSGDSLWPRLSAEVWPWGRCWSWWRCRVAAVLHCWVCLSPAPPDWRCSTETPQHPAPDAPRLQTEPRCPGTTHACTDIPHKQRKCMQTHPCMLSNCTHVCTKYQCHIGGLGVLL